MKNLTITYAIAAIIILTLAVLRFMNIYNGTYLMFVTVLLVSFMQMSYIQKLEKKLKENNE